MIRYTLALILGLTLGFVSAAFAQDAVPVVTNDEALQALFSMVGGLKGASAIAIAYAVCQFLMKFIGTPWADSLLKNNGQWKLTIYLVLSLLVTTLGVVVAGGTWGAALASGGAVAAFGVLVNQLWKQFMEKKN